MLWIPGFARVKRAVKSLADAWQLPEQAEEGAHARGPALVFFWPPLQEAAVRERQPTAIDRPLAP
jgi:hypothetical protein